MKKYILITILSCMVLSACASPEVSPKDTATSSNQSLPDATLAADSHVYVSDDSGQKDITEYITDFTNYNCSVSSKMLTDLFGYKKVETQSGGDVETVEYSDGTNDVIFLVGYREMIWNGKTRYASGNIQKTDSGDVEVSLVDLLHQMTDNPVDIIPDGFSVSYSISGGKFNEKTDKTQG